jgi:solute:Na+ symporter, SSS family
MALIDWSVLFLTLSAIVVYGLWITRRSATEKANDYLAGERNLPWWTIGLSIMSTQASAITFLSTPGQGFEDGMQFVQFYFGIPIAMVILAYWVVPIYYRLRVTTAYEYLEQRFDVRMRSLTAALFLVQRGLGAGLSIYAPSIIFSMVFGWDLVVTNLLMCSFVILYTTTGGSEAVSRTQQLQMTIMLGGLILAFVLALNALPEGIGWREAWQVASSANKTQIIDWGFHTDAAGTSYFDWSDRYNVWSGILGATFLFMSYFGTDQSQVGRYLSGRSLRESRMGLLFNGLIKIPVQLLILGVGVIVFVFYQYNPPPLHFNTTQRDWVRKSHFEPAFQRLEQQADSIFQIKQLRLAEPPCATQQAALNELEQARKQLRQSAKMLIWQADPKCDTALYQLSRTQPEFLPKKVNERYKDTDYVFIYYVLRHIPTGLVGVLLAMIFCAAWSTTASELNALTATTVSDFYRRHWVTGRSDQHYLQVARLTTVLWGGIITCVAIYNRLFDNLIQAVNMIGSVFYGPILGIFFTAFFLKKVGATAVFWAAVIAQILIAGLFFWVSRDPFLWYVPLGCGLVMGIGCFFEWVRKMRLFP